MRAAASTARAFTPTAVLDAAVGPSPIRLFRAHAALRKERRRASTTRHTGTLETARSSVSSSILATLAGLAALLALTVAIGLVVFGGSDAKRRLS